MHTVQLATKRVCDFIAAILGLVILGPITIIVAILVRFKLGSPVFFRQQRPGHRGKGFMMIKFRTMTDAKDANGKLLSDAERLPAFGAFLRSSSLDELPELVNVLKGDMSLVGPRPLMMKYLPRYTPEQARRHEAKPGITGWAQINGRNNISWPERFELDGWYVDHWSLYLDAAILFRTFIQVFKRAGVAQDGHATVQEFMGSQDDTE